MMFDIPPRVRDGLVVLATAGDDEAVACRSVGIVVHQRVGIAASLVLPGLQLFGCILEIFHLQ